MEVQVLHNCSDPDIGKEQPACTVSLEKRIHPNGSFMSCSNFATVVLFLVLASFFQCILKTSLSGLNSLTISKSCQAEI